ncbi:amidohydrolase [Saccharopolyspora sp. NPDC002686]|uniref:amidohydrolase n=1 Tax=Saccharopolyspora sp. NPDC002686 TaxID=3154541 RepID=UPI0033333D90
MTSADIIFTGGTVLTADRKRPTAEAVAVAGDRILAIGTTAEVLAHQGPKSRTIDLRGGCLMPGFVEAHGHPVLDGIVRSGAMIDIRPVTAPTAADVLDRIKRELVSDDDRVAHFFGWDPLLQEGLVTPEKAWMDEMAPDRPFIITHNSGHAVYFNTAAARVAGVSSATEDPTGGSFGRDGDGELTGVAYESAGWRLRALTAHRPDELIPVLATEFAALSAAGVTTISDIGFDPAHRPAFDQAARNGVLTARVRMYEKAGPALRSEVPLDNGDDLVKQIGIKIWCDGSPWVGNIATSFPYLNTPQTTAMGLGCDHRGHPNYTPEQLREISEAYFAAGWQLACHVHGDEGVDMVLDVWEELLGRQPRPDHRLRLEHCGTMTAEQYARAARIGATCSLFVDHLHYWGDVLVDGLFGPERGARWAAAGSAVWAGLRISLHNDPPVTPEEPLRNIAVATTRQSSSGRVLAPEERLTVDQAIRAQTIDPAWQLFCDDQVGSLEPGKYADLVVLSADPHRVPPREIAGLEVRATFLGGRQVHGEVL